MGERLKVLSPPGWPRPRGYANGIVATGRMLFVAGQVGWDEREQMVSGGFAGQFRQALANVLAVVHEAGGAPTDIARMTIFVTDLAAYGREVKAVGEAYRALMGKHYPVMSLIGVAGLIEPGALLEIEATAVLADLERTANG